MKAPPATPASRRAKAAQIRNEAYRSITYQLRQGRITAAAAAAELRRIYRHAEAVARDLDHSPTGIAP